MNNVQRIVSIGVCTGCEACNICDNITFSDGSLGFQVPHVAENCIECGKCLSMCIFDPEREDDE